MRLNHGEKKKQKLFKIEHKLSYQNESSVVIQIVDQWRVVSWRLKSPWSHVTTRLYWHFHNILKQIDNDPRLICQLQSSWERWLRDDGQLNWAVVNAERQWPSEKTFMKMITCLVIKFLRFSSAARLQINRNNNLHVGKSVGILKSF